MNKKQDGFGVIEGLLIVVIIGLIGFTGWYVWHSKQSIDKTYNATANSAANPATSTTSKSNDASSSQDIVIKDNTKYLDIKEWGVEIPLSSAIDSVVYASGHYDIGGGSSPDDAMLGLLSLGSSCGEISDAPSAPLGWYVRFTQADVNAEDTSQVTSGSTSLHELAQSAVTLSGTGYYYAYAQPTYDCSSGEDTATVNTATAAFEQALQSIKSD